MTSSTLGTGDSTGSSNGRTMRGSSRVEEHSQGAPPGDAVLAAFHQSQVISLVLEGPEFRIVAANALVGALVGGGREFLGHPYAEVFGDVLGQGYLDLLRTVLDRGEPQTLREWRVTYTLPDGGVLERYVTLMVNPWLDDDGRVRGVVGQGIDVTDEVRARLAVEAEATDLQRRLRDSHQLVSALQDTLLPQGLPVLPGLQISGRYAVAQDGTSAGGDWLDLVPLPEGRVALVVGDVVGHGVGAAALMGQLRAVLVDRLEAGVGAVAALRALDAYAARRPEARAATVLVADLDPATGTLFYCTAGHPPPLVVSAGQARFLEPTGAGPLASGVELHFSLERLAPGDLLLLYTDGLLERPGRTPDRATLELAEVVGRVVRGEAFPGTEEHLADRVAAQTLELLVRQTGHTDDITLLAAQLVAPTPPFRLEVPADRAAVGTVRHALGEWLAGLAPSADDVLAVQHAVGEWVTNAATHAYAGRPGTVVCRAQLRASGELEVTVADHGRWQPPTRDPADPTGGRGIALSRQLVDRVHVTAGAAGTALTLTHRLSRPVHLLPGHTLHHPTAAPSLAPFRWSEEPGLLRVSGSLDAEGADELRVVLARQQTALPPSTTLELTDLSLLSSAGVQVLVDAVASYRRQGTTLDLRAEPGSVAQHVLAITGLAHLTVDEEWAGDVEG